MPAIDLAVTAAMLAEGALTLRTRAEHELLYSYDGCYGFMTELCSHAELFLRIEDAAFAVLQDNWDCVWGYEVVSPYGEWFAAETVRRGGTMPTRAEQVDKAFSLIMDACEGMTHDREVRERLNALLVEERIRV